MFIPTYLYIHIHTYTGPKARVEEGGYHVSRLESILLYTDIFICIFISLYTCICIHVYTDLLIHTHAYTRRGQGVHAYICIHIHTYTGVKARVGEGHTQGSRPEWRRGNVKCHG